MRTKLDLKKFLRFDIFKHNKPNEVELLCMVKTVVEKTAFYDFYLRTPNGIYYIFAGSSLNEGTFKTNVEIECDIDLNDMRTFNFIGKESGGVEKVHYFIPKKPMFLEVYDYEINGDYVSVDTNFFKIYEYNEELKSPYVFSYLQEKDFKRGTSFDVIEKYFTDEEEKKRKIYITQGNDDYTKRIAFR